MAYVCYMYDVFLLSVIDDKYHSLGFWFLSWGIMRFLGSEKKAAFGAQKYIDTCPVGAAEATKKKGGGIRLRQKQTTTTGNEKKASFLEEIIRGPLGDFGLTTAGCGVKLDTGGGGGVKLDNLWNKKKKKTPKSTLLAKKKK